jgi:hypothetical protein
MFPLLETGLKPAAAGRTAPVRAADEAECRTVVNFKSSNSIMDFNIMRGDVNLVA